MTIFQELKRRNVIRVGALYLVAAWLLLQLTDVLSSLLPVPEWTGSLVFLLLALFMIAVTRLRPLTTPRDMPVSRLDVEPYRYQYAIGGAMIAVTVVLYITFW